MFRKERKIVWNTENTGNTGITGSGITENRFRQKLPVFPSLIELRHKNHSRSSR